MTTEEKAQKYDNAIGKAVALYKASEPMSGCNVILETLFPELTESENEKIRKWIIDDIRYNIDNEPLNNSEYRKKAEKAIAWLEKQGDSSICNIPSKEIILAIWDLGNEWKELTGGSISTEYDTQLNYIQNHWHESEYYLRAMQNEQKLIDKVEPKFEIGDLITNGILVGEIDEINKFGYHAYFGDHYADVPDIENWHKWTIQDAKEGDVLYINNTLSESIMIYKSFNNGVTNKYASYNKFGFEGENYLTLNDGYIIPATKEQRDLLFQKMNEAGYEWDAEKKELKVKPKFKVGDWLVHNERKHIVKVVNATPMVYEVVNILGYHHTITDTAIENNYHLWTLEDAKDGDVLYFSDETIVIFKDLYNATTFHSYCHIEDGEFGISCEALPDWWEGKEFQPATTEQRDLFFQKMKEAGWEWDAENKQLNYIVHNTYCQENCKGFQETGKCFADGDCEAKREAEQKLAWSEDDNLYYDDICEILINLLHSERTDINKVVIQKDLDWLWHIKKKTRRSLNDVTKEITKNKETAMSFLKSCGIMNANGELADEYRIEQDEQKPTDEEMKRLLQTEYEKGRADAIAEMQNGWSEEDEKKRKCLIKGLEDRMGFGWAGDTFSREEYINWLKSLRPKNR